MLRRKHKKMRNKRGGADSFFEKWKAGANKIKYATKTSLEKTKTGLKNAKVAANTAKREYDNQLNRDAVGGDKDPVLSFDYEKFADEEFGKYTSPLARKHNRGSEFSRNSEPKPIHKPILTSIPKKPEKLEAIETVTFGGRRKRKTKRRRGGKRKTRRKKKRKSRRKSRRKSHKSRRRR